MKKELVLGTILGSLRKDSYNKKILESLHNLLPEGVKLKILSIEDIPFYNGDNDLPIAEKRPETVTKFREELAKVDGMIIISPEYNSSIPGILKNAIDWASRGQDSPWNGKPVSLMGGTIGAWGTVRMQLSFLPIFNLLGNKKALPDVLIPNISKKFDENGMLIDQNVMKLIKSNLKNLKEIILKNIK